MPLLILESVGATELILILLVLLLITTIAFVIKKLSMPPEFSKKKCLFCVELIQPEAVICRFCGKDLPK